MNRWIQVREERSCWQEDQALQVNDKTLEFDQDGFMIDPNLWDEKVACAIAGEEGIDDLSETHWKIVNFIREYWKEHDLAPPVRLICKELGVGVRDIYKLFKSGPARGACRVPWVIDRVRWVIDRVRWVIDPPANSPTPIPTVGHGGATRHLPLDP